MRTIQKQTIQNFPEDICELPRRRFLKRLLGSAAALTAVPSISFASKLTLDNLSNTVARLETNKIGDEAFWQLVKEQFMIRKDLIMLNAANLCPSPYPVQQMVFKLTKDIDTDPSSINRGKFSKLQENTRVLLAEYLNVSPEEIAIIRNTSEGNNTVISGMTFKQGDEVVIWDENHPTANVAWDVRAKRYGFSVIRVKLPPVIKNTKDLIKPFSDVFTRKTKLVSFSHVSNLSGVALPAKEVCKIAKEKNILTHIDGAQTFGSQVVDLNDIDCDFYTGSSHKWFIGPKEVGVLYVRKNLVSDLWPSIVGVGYQGSLDKGAKKLETLGQRDDSRIAAMGTAVEFHNTIGKERIEKRIRFLASVLKTKLKKRISKIKFYTPIQSELSGGVIVFSAPGIDLNKALNTLYQKHNIGCAVFGGDLAGIRMCPHIYNTEEEIDKTVDAVAILV
jgi:isopenicillin-N epimerase